MFEANVVDGKLVYDTTSTYEQKTSGDQLGKNEFLQLLVTQMQYQDPLQPMDNTEYISQLAQFSALEAMQNVSQVLSNQNALGLVGKNVIMAVGSSEGNTSAEVAGKVDYVQMIDGKAYLFIEDEKYSIDDLEYVVGDDYLDSIIKDQTDKSDTK